MNNFYEVAKGISSIDLSLSDHDFIEKIIESLSSLHNIKSVWINIPHSSVKSLDSNLSSFGISQPKTLKKISNKNYCPIVSQNQIEDSFRAFIPIVEGKTISLISTIDFYESPNKETMLSLEYLISTTWFRLKEKINYKKYIDESTFLRWITQKGNIGLFDWDMANGIVLFSDILKQKLGHEPSDVPNTYQEWENRLHPDDKQTALQHINECIQKRSESFILEHRLRHKSGHYLWVRAQASIFYNQSGQAYRMFGVHLDINELKKTQENYRNLAHFDNLTGLPNRNFFETSIYNLILDNSNNTQKSALLFLDIDRFKNINDSMGHHYGDELLIKCSKRLKNNLREIDLCARLGGDEFAIFIQDFNSHEEILALAKRLIAEISKPYNIFGCTAFVGLSIGIAFTPEDAVDLIQLKRAADIALYNSKADGRGIYSIYCKEMSDFAIDRQELETALRAAITNGQLRLHYQPKISLVTGRLIGFEALARWYHPQRGYISPDIFIKLAEETGLIIELGKWAIVNATRQIQKWQQSGYSPGKVAVNVSSKQLVRSDLVNDVRQAILDSKISPQSLELEITESFLVNDPAKAGEVLRKIKGMGVSISIDDFGTGFSSLGYIKDLPCDTIKIDQSFVNDITGETRSLALVRAIIAMSNELGLDVIAEGIECKEHVDVLQKLGCNKGQGWYFSKALPVDQVVFDSVY